MSKTLAQLRAAAYAAAQPAAVAPAPTAAQQEVLALLAGNDGALLWFQLPRRLWDAAADAVAAGVIRSDPGSDLYVHPLAVEVEPGAYEMPAAPVAPAKRRRAKSPPVGPCEECSRSFGPHYRGPCEHGA